MPTIDNIDNVVMLSDPKGRVVAEVRIEAMDTAVAAHLDSGDGAKYNPENPYLMLDKRFGVETTSEEAAKYHETMEAARRFLARIDKVNEYGNPEHIDPLSSEYASMMDTHFTRKTELLKLIKQFEQADELTQAIVQRDLNKAIRNINAEEAGNETLIYVPNATVDKFVDDMKKFDATQPTSLQALENACTTYSLMDNNVQAFAAPALGTAIDQYMALHPDQKAEIAERLAATKAFESGVISIDAETSAVIIPSGRRFNTANLSTEYTNDIVEEHRNNLSTLDVTSMTTTQLQEVVNAYKDLTDNATRQALYDDYAAFIHHYIEEHSRSTVALTIEQDFKQSYIASCDPENKALHAFFDKYPDMDISPSERTMYLDRMERMLNDYQNLDADGRAAARGVVADYVSQFNHVDIPEVKVAYETERVAEPQRYSEAYYEIRDAIRLWSSTPDAAVDTIKVTGADRALHELSYTEMYQISTMKEVKALSGETDATKNPFLELQQEVAAMQSIKASLAKGAIVSDEDMVKLAQQFTSLTPEHRNEVFHDFVDKMNRTEHVSNVVKMIGEPPASKAERELLTAPEETIKTQNKELYDRMHAIVYSESFHTDKMEELRNKLGAIPGFQDAYATALTHSYAGAETVGVNDHIKNIRSMYLVEGVHGNLRDGTEARPNPVNESIIINQERLSIGAGATTKAKIDYELAMYRTTFFDMDQMLVGSPSKQLGSYLDFGAKQDFKHVSSVADVKTMFEQFGKATPFEQQILYPQVEETYQKFIQANPTATKELHAAYSTAVGANEDYQRFVTANFQATHGSVSNSRELMAYVQDFRALPDAVRQDLLPEYIKTYLDYSSEHSNFNAQLTRMIKSLDDEQVKAVSLARTLADTPEERKQALLHDISVSDLGSREMYMQRASLAIASESFAQQYTQILDNLPADRLEKYGEKMGVALDKDIKEQLQEAFKASPADKKLETLTELAKEVDVKVSYRNPMENNGNLEFERTLMAELQAARSAGAISFMFEDDVYRAISAAQTTANERLFAIDAKTPTELTIVAPIEEARERIAHPLEVQHEADCYREAIKLRNSLTHSRGEAGLDVVVSKFEGASDMHVREIAAQTFIDKVEGYYNSGASRTELYYTATQGDHDVRYRIESVVSPNAFYGINTETNERTLVMTQEPLDIPLPRNQIELGSVMNGVPVVEFRDDETRKRFEDTAEFRVENGKIMVDVYGTLTPEYETNLKGSFTSYEVVGMDQYSFQNSVIRLQNDKGETFDVVTGLTQSKIASAIDYDIRIKDGIYQVAETNIEPETAKKTLEAYSQNFEYQRKAGIVGDLSDAMSEPVGRVPMFTKTMDGHIVKGDDGNYVLQHNDNEYVIKSMSQVKDSDKIIVTIEEDGHDKRYLLSETLSQTQDRLAKIDSFESKSGEDVSFTSWRDGNIAMSFRNGYDSEMIVVSSIREVDGKAVISGFSTDGQQKPIEVKTEMEYTAAVDKFATAYVVSLERADAKHAIDVSDVEMQKGKIGVEVSWQAEDGKAKSGTLIAMGEDHLIVQEEHGPIHRLNTPVDLTKAQDVVVTNEDAHTILVGGAGAEKRADAFISRDAFDTTTRNLSVVYPEHVDTFTAELKTVLEGHEVPKDADHYKIGTIAAMNATATDGNTYAVTVLTDDGNQMKAYRLEGLSPEQFVQIAQAAQIEKYSPEAAEAIKNTKNPIALDPELVTNGFNAIKSPEAMVIDMKNNMVAGDIEGAVLIEKNGTFSLKGKDHEGHSITLNDIMIREERGEYFVYSANDDGVQRNRIVSAAFGEFTPIKNAAEHYQELTWDKILGEAKVLQNVDVLYTVQTDMKSVTPAIQDVFVDKIGLSFDYSGSSISAEKFSLDDKTSISTQYGVIITNEGKDGPKFFYYVPEGESHLHMSMSIEEGKPTAGAKAMHLSELPADLASSNFVLVDYQNAIAIREGGVVYQLDKAEIASTYSDKIPQNYYDPKIAEPIDALMEHATYVSEERFAGKTPAMPAVNNWTIQPGVDGFKISFSEMGADDKLNMTTSPIGQSFALKSLTYGPDGLMADISIDGKPAETVKLGEPTAAQIALMEKATESLIAPTGPDKIKAYVDMINDLSYNAHQSNDKALDSLNVGQYVIVKNEGESVGVLYQIIGKNHDLVLVGESDNEMRHPTLIHSDELAHKTLYAVDDLSKTVRDNLRFRGEITYAEIDETKVGKAEKMAITLGEKDLASDYVNGATYSCKISKIDVEPEKTMDKVDDKEDGISV